MSGYVERNPNGTWSGAGNCARQKSLAIYSLINLEANNSLNYLKGIDEMKTGKGGHWEVRLVSDVSRRYGANSNEARE